jgi:hypothetical protein
MEDWPKKAEVIKDLEKTFEGPKIANVSHVPQSGDKLR